MLNAVPGSQVLPWYSGSDGPAMRQDGVGCLKDDFWWAAVVC